MLRTGRERLREEPEELVDSYGRHRGSLLFILQEVINRWRAGALRANGPTDEAWTGIGDPHFLFAGSTPLDSSGPKGGITMTIKPLRTAIFACSCVAGVALLAGLTGCGSESPEPQRAEQPEPAEGQPEQPEQLPSDEPSPAVPELPGEPAWPAPELPGAAPEQPEPAEPGPEPPSFPQPPVGEPPSAVEPPRGSEPGPTGPAPGGPSPIQPPPEEPPPEELPPMETPATSPEVVPAEPSVTSSAFEQGEPIPKKYTGDGEDVSPPLAWSGLPAGTKQLALVCDDPDAPRPEPWVHWVIYAIPPQTAGLSEGVPRTERLADPPGALQGKSSWPTDNLGYRGPAPPPDHGPHRYFFKLYALDTALALKPGLSKDELLKAIEGHVLAEAQLTGTYDR